MFEKKLKSVLYSFGWLMFCLLAWMIVVTICFVINRGLYAMLLNPVDLLKTLIAIPTYIIWFRIITGMVLFTFIFMVSKNFNDIEENPKLYYDEQRKYQVVKYNGETEYFNREDEENNTKNALACYKRLKEVETQKKK